MSRSLLEGIFGSANEEIVGSRKDLTNQVFSKRNFSNTNVIGSKKDIEKNISISQLKKIFSK